MKEIFKNGGKLFIKLIFVNILSLFLVISFTVIFNSLQSGSIIDESGIDLPFSHFDTACVETCNTFASSS